MSINNCMSNIDNDVEHCIKTEMQTLSLSLDKSI